MSAWKEESAVRIMEALSGVDEELLERCGRQKPVKIKKTTNVSENGRAWGFMRRYGKACAACICLALLGAAYGVSTLRTDSSAGGTSSDAVKPESVMQEAAEEYEVGSGDEIPAEGGEETVVTEEAESFENISRYAETEPVWLDIDMLVENASGHMERAESADSVSQELLSSAIPEQKSEKTEDAEDKDDMSEKLTDSVSGTAVSWEDVYAVSGLGNHVPTELPEGYTPLFAEQSAGEDVRNSLLLTWENQEYILWLNLTETELDADMLQGSDAAVFSAEEDWQSRIPEPGEDGGIQFALLYDDGVLAEYKGWLTTDEITDLFAD